MTIVFFLQLKNYELEIEEMKNMNRQEYVAHLRRYLEVRHYCFSLLLFFALIFVDSIIVFVFGFAGKAVDSPGELLYTEV